MFQAKCCRENQNTHFRLWDKV